MKDLTSPAQLCVCFMPSSDSELLTVDKRSETTGVNVNELDISGSALPQLVS